jgi:Holliday junction resolvase RusA-like endonuclease
MSAYRVWLPFPPSANNLFSQGVVKGKVRRFPHPRYKRWQATALVLLAAARHIPHPIRQPVVIDLALTPRDNRRRDASNYVKAVEDALVKARILADDGQRHVKSITPRWEQPSRECGVTVTIRAAELPLLEAGAAAA